MTLDSRERLATLDNAANIADSASKMAHIDDLLELTTLTRAQAEAVMVWHEVAKAESQAEAVVDSIVHLLGWLLEDGKTRLRAIGLAYAIKRPDLGGWTSLSDAADSEGVAENTIANWRDRAAEELGMGRPTPSRESSKAKS